MTTWNSAFTNDDDWSLLAHVEMFAKAVNQRRSLLPNHGSFDVVEPVIGTDVQGFSYWQRNQYEIEVMCPRFLDTAVTWEGQGSTDKFIAFPNLTIDRMRVLAGIYPAGWRRKKPREITSTDQVGDNEKNPVETGYFALNTQSGRLSTVTVTSNDPPLSVTSLTRFSSTVTVVTATAHGYVIGEWVVIAGAIPDEYNGGMKIFDVIDATTFTFKLFGSPPTPATGTITSTRKSAAWVATEPTKPVAGITRVGTLATVACAGHGFADSDGILIAGAAQSAYNGDKIIDVLDANTFTYPVTGSPATPATGTITAGRRLTGRPDVLDSSQAKPHKVPHGNIVAGDYHGPHIREEIRNALNVMDTIRLDAVWDGNEGLHKNVGASDNDFPTAQSAANAAFSAASAEAILTAHPMMRSWNIYTDQPVQDAKYFSAQLTATTNQSKVAILSLAIACDISYWVRAGLSSSYDEVVFDANGTGVTRDTWHKFDTRLNVSNSTFNRSAVLGAMTLPANASAPPSNLGRNTQTIRGWEAADLYNAGSPTSSTVGVADYAKGLDHSRLSP